MNKKGAVAARTGSNSLKNEPDGIFVHLTHMDSATVMDDLKSTNDLAASRLERSIEAAVGGDTRAFESLMEPRLARTYRIALAVLGSEADARDAVQDGWVAAWRHLPSLANPTRFDAWIDQIVVNACRTSLRRRHRVREVAIPSDFDPESMGPRPEDVAERQVLERAFDRLTLDQRTILVLHHLEHRPLTAIAEVLGIPIGTAKSRLHTARAVLERTLEAES